MTSLLSSIPSSRKIRGELEQMVLKDLIGPVGGPEEEIDEPSVRDRYLVGMLAPKRQKILPRSSTTSPPEAAGPAKMAPPRLRPQPPRRCFPRRSV